MKRYFILTLVLLNWYGLNELLAQFKLSERHEVIQEDHSKFQYKVIPLKEKGLISFSIKEPWSYSKQKEFKFEFLDTLLNVVRQQNYMLPYAYTEPNRIFFDNNKWLYFFAQDKHNLEINIWKLNIFSEANELYLTKLPLKMEVLEFQVADEVAYMIGQYNGKSVAVSYNFLDKVPKVLPSFFEEKEEVREIQADNRGNQMNFIIANNSPRACKLFIKPYSNLIGSKKRLEIKYNPREDPTRTFNNARVYSLDATQQLVLGTYSLNCSESIQGLFSANFNNGEQNSVTYYKFTDFGNFFKHYGTRKAEKMQQKIAKRNEQGKDYLLNRKFYLHPQILEKENELVLVLEGFYNHTPNNNAFGRRNVWASNYYFPGMYNYYNPYSNYNMMPLGSSSNMFNNNNSSIVHNFAYAVVCGFDKKGRKLWDNVLKIENVEATQFTDLVKMGKVGDSLVLAYIKNNEIYSKFIYRSKELKAESAQKIKTIFEGYKLDDTEEDEFLHWYGNNFILFGEQKLQNPSPNEYGKKFFHISKLKYESLKEEEKPDKEIKEAKPKKKKTKKADTNTENAASPNKEKKN